MGRIGAALLALFLASGCRGGQYGGEIRDEDLTFQQLVVRAIATSQPFLRLPARIERSVPTIDPHVHLVISGARDLVVDGSGATLLATTLTRAINVQNSSNLTVVGLTVDYYPLPFTQGRVHSVATDNATVDVQLDAGYPRVLISRVRFADNTTRREKDGTSFPWGASVAWAPGSGPSDAAPVVRISGANMGQNVFRGDLAYFSGAAGPGGIEHAVAIYDGPNALLAARSRDVSFVNVTVFSAPGMGFVDAGALGGTVLRGVDVIPGPAPLLASGERGAPRLQSSSFDALNFGSCRGLGPQVTGCSIKNAGDDSWSVQPHDYLVLKSVRATSSSHGTGAESYHMVVASRETFGGIFFRGDVLAPGLGGPTGMAVAMATVVSEVAGVRKLSEAGLNSATIARVLAAKPYSLWAVGGPDTRCLNFTVTVSAEASVGWAAAGAVGRSLYSPSWACSRFRFTDNVVDSSGRLLIKSGPGTVANNTVISAHGIVVATELPPGGAAGITSVKISDNWISLAGGHENMPYGAQGGAVSIAIADSEHQFRNVSADIPIALADIEVTGNTFDRCHGPNLVLASVVNATVSGNRFLGSFENSVSTSGASYGVPSTALIFVSQVSGVRFDANRVGSDGEPGPEATQCVGLGPGAKGNIAGLPGNATSGGAWCKLPGANKH